MEICLLKDNGKLRIQTNVHRLGPLAIPHVCHVPDPPFLIGHSLDSVVLLASIPYPVSIFAWSNPSWNFFSVWLMRTEKFPEIPKKPICQVLLSGL